MAELIRDPTMVKFTVETRLACSAAMYIADKDTAVYKKFHVRAPRPPQPPATSLGRARAFRIVVTDLTSPLRDDTSPRAAN